MLIRIVAPHFVAGIIWPTRFAPILKYMRFWTVAGIETYCKRKGWQFTKIDA